MRFISHVLTSALVVVALSSARGVQAQTTDVSGHYEGAISSPAGEISIQIDLTKDAKGDMMGTLTIPAQKLTGFPLTNVVVKGQDVAFDIATSGGGYFRGELAGNGISGEFSTQMGPFPLTLERAGEAHTFSAPKSALVSKDIEGVWNGTLDADGGMRVVVKLENLSDGTATGRLISVDENNLELPAGIVQDGTKLTLTLPMVGSSYVGTVNLAGTDISGTYTTSRGPAFALVLKRASGN